MIQIGDMVRVRTLQEMFTSPRSCLLETGNIIDIETNIVFNITTMSEYIGRKAIVVDSIYLGKYRLNFGRGRLLYIFTEMMLEKI